MMATVQIRKFVNGRHEKTIRLPRTLVGIAARLAPKAALWALSVQELNLRELAAACQRDNGYATPLRLRENGIDKIIEVSVC